MLFDQLAVLNNPRRTPLTAVQQDGIWNYLEFLVVHLYLFEVVSCLMLGLLLQGYAKALGLTFVRLERKAILLYQLKFLPLLLLSIVVFGPVTNTLRYLLLFYPAQGWNSYFPEFFLTWSMYFNYLVPILVLGYGLINTNLLLNYSQWQKQHAQEQIPVTPAAEPGSYLQSIEALDAEGTRILLVSEVVLFEVENKSYFAWTAQERLQIRKTITELEQELPPDAFFKVNRSQIINLIYLKNYSFWENDKYVLRLTVYPEKELTITRQRVKLLKQKLQTVVQKCSKI